MVQKIVHAALGLCFLMACQPGGPKPVKTPPKPGEVEPKDDAKAPEKEAIVAALKAETAPPASPRVKTPFAAELAAKVESHFAGQMGRRVHIQTDKPLYKPGETIWIKTWDLLSKTLAASPSQTSIHYKLVSPKGSVVLEKRTRQEEAMATNDFLVPDHVQGGEYKLRVITSDGKTFERPLIISTYEPPRIKKKLEFVRKAYGAGDQVSATIMVKRPTGEPLKNHPLRGVVMLDGEVLAPISAKTNASGGAILKFQLPGKIEKGDGLLTVMVEDGGITESISKRIPIILKKLQFSTYPEGGQLVEGLPSRLYFSAKTTIGKPADVEGKIVDDQGQTVAKIRTYKFGLGRTDFTPSTGRKYHVEITKPAGVTEHYPVPLPESEGCVLRSYDDLDGELNDLRVAVHCTSDQEVTVTAFVRENFIDAAVLAVQAGKPAVAYLKSKTESLNRARGVARITVLSKTTPIAERIVFRNRRNGLTVKIETDETAYSPREQVALTVRTVDREGKPVPAEIALSVVDDTVISFADDKTGHMLSKLLFEGEIPGKVEEPKFFLNLKKKKSALALDLLMGTRGYRKFNWVPVFSPPKPSLSTVGLSAAFRGGGDASGFGKAEGRRRGPMAVAAPAPAGGKKKEARKRPAAPRKARAMNKPAPAPDAVRPPPPPADPVVAAPQAQAEAAPEAEPVEEAMPEMKRPARARRLMAKRGAKVGRLRDIGVEGKADMAMDKDWAGAANMKAAQVSFAVVRAFPAPQYTGAFSGVRTDFRETIHWAPRVKTDTKGKALVTFFLSDAVTSFRVFAEANGGERIGRAEKVFKSSLPFSMSVKLPYEVSAGDKIHVPLTLTNDRATALPIALNASFGDMITVSKQPEISSTKSLAGNARESLFYDVEVTGKQGKSEVRFAADAGGLKDEFVRTLNVVPLGFPQAISKSGSLAKSEGLEFDLGEALPGTVTAKITIFPSPTSTLLSGIEGMIRQPYGCFEQTSSSNYPNIMIMDYLRSTNVADPELLERVGGVLDKGYKKLVGFETSKKGFEWFGRAPAHEALTAYGVLEFVDMKRVYGGIDDRMIQRTVDYLKARRDGKGGFKRDGKALDSFGRANPEITDAYIVYAVTEAGIFDMSAEIDAQQKRAQQTDDPYLLALATNIMLNVPAKKSVGLQLAAKLAKMQQSDGHWAGKIHSITRSTGKNLTVETTGLAILALLKTGEYDAQIRSGVQWLVQNRYGHGAWGATQATVLALKALTQYAIASSTMKSSGVVSLIINGKEVRRLSYASGQRDPLVFEGFGSLLTSNTNTIDLKHEVTSGESKSLPYSLAVDFRSSKPASHPKTVVGLETKIAKTDLRMGDNVRVTAIITNKTTEGQPMTLARIGLPGGLTFQTWQLKELRENGLIAFYETRAREVILYFRQLKPGEVKEIPLDLVAVVPGEYTGPASRAYLYYTDDQKVWVDPLAVTITP